MSDLEVVQGELQHVSEDIAEDLSLPLQQDALIVQRLNDLRLHLGDGDTHTHTHTDPAALQTVRAPDTQEHPEESTVCVCFHCTLLHSHSKNTLCTSSGQTVVFALGFNKHSDALRSRDSQM